jgi:hypothetical protein
MKQGLRAVVPITMGRLGLVAAGIITVAAMVAPASAVAAPVAGPASAAPADSGGPIAYTGTKPGTTTQCTSHWQWSATPGIGGSSAVEWTSNPCNFSIQDRSWCVGFNGSGSWSNSGVVVKADLWDGSSCLPATTGVTSGTSISRGEVRFMDAGGWKPYTSFWS